MVAEQNMIAGELNLIEKQPYKPYKVNSQVIFASKYI